MCYFCQKLIKMVGVGVTDSLFFLGNYPELEILALVIQHSLQGFIDGDSMVANDLDHAS